MYQLICCYHSLVSCEIPVLIISLKLGRWRYLAGKMVFNTPFYFLRHCRMQSQRVNLFPSFNRSQLLPCHIKIFSAPCNSLHIKICKIFLLIKITVTFHKPGSDFFFSFSGVVWMPFSWASCGQASLMRLPTPTGVNLVLHCSLCANTVQSFPKSLTPWKTYWWWPRAS